MRSPPAATSSPSPVAVASPTRRRRHPRSKLRPPRRRSRRRPRRAAGRAPGGRRPAEPVAEEASTAADLAEEEKNGFQGALASQGGDDTEGARLIALNMALNGTPREETDRYLSENFELTDRSACSTRSTRASRVEGRG